MLGAKLFQSVLYAFVPLVNSLYVGETPFTTPGWNRYPSPLTREPGTQSGETPVMPHRSSTVAIE